VCKPVVSSNPCVLKNVEKDRLSPATGATKRAEVQTRHHPALARLRVAVEALDHQGGEDLRIV
jgi:hypothetical protein